MCFGLFSYIPLLTEREILGNNAAINILFLRSKIKLTLEQSVATMAVQDHSLAALSVNQMNHARLMHKVRTVSWRQP